MLGLPKSTEFNRRIPKQKFYENLSATPAQKRIFIEQIKVIYWRNKIAPTTMNLAAGDNVTEIEIIEVKLVSPQLDAVVLRQIDKEIPYHILFLLEYEGKYQAWIAYKEAVASGNNAFKIGAYYHTDWHAEQELQVRIDGFSTDAVYESFVRQIAGEALQICQYVSEFIKNTGYDGVRFFSSRVLQSFCDESYVNYTIFNFDKCEPISSDLFYVFNTSIRTMTFEEKEAITYHGGIK